MNEYEVGKVYEFDNKPGKWYRFLGGDPNSPSAWQEVASPLDPPPAQPKRSSADAAFGRAFTNRALFGFGDEIAGSVIGALVPGVSMPEARATQRRINEQMREEHPRATLAGDIASALLPIGTGAAVAHGAGGGAVRAAATGGATAGAVSAVQGIGDAEGGILERLGPGLREGIVGGVLGAVMAPAAVLAPRIRKATRNLRITKALEKEAQVTRTINSAYREAKNAVDAARKKFYAPLERELKTVADPEIGRLVRSPQFREHMSKISDEVVRGADPSFTQLQALRRRLRNDVATAKRKGEANALDDAQALLQQFDEVVYSKIPQWRTADEQFALFAARERALRLGRKAASPRFSAEDVQREFIEKLPAEAHANFRQGYLYESFRQLERGNAAYVRRLLNADPEMRRALRLMFPSERNFERFMTILERERDAEVLADAFKKLGKGFITGAGIGLGAAGIWHFFGGRSSGEGGNPHIEP